PVRPTTAAVNEFPLRLKPNSSRDKFAALRRPPLRSGPSGAGRPGRAFLCRTEGNALAMGQRPPAPDKRISKMASNRSKSAPKRETRQALTFEMALQLCPHEGVAENVATAFGLIAPDYETIRAEHASALKRMAEAFEGPQRKGDRDALPAHRRGPRKLRGRGGTLLLHQGRRGPHRNRPGSRRGRRRTGLPDRPREQGAADPRIRSRHGDAGLRPPRRRPRRDRRLQGPHRRRLEGLRSPGRDPSREEGRHRPDGRLRGLTPPAGTERSPP